MRDAALILIFLIVLALMVCATLPAPVSEDDTNRNH